MAALEDGGFQAFGCSRSWAFMNRRRMDGLSPEPGSCRRIVRVANGHVFGFPETDGLCRKGRAHETGHDAAARVLAVFVACLVPVATGSFLFGRVFRVFLFFAEQDFPEKVKREELEENQRQGVAIPRPDIGQMDEPDDQCNGDHDDYPGFLAYFLRFVFQ